MIYELRSYDINPDNWDEYRAWCETLAFPLFLDQFDFPLVGFFEVLPPVDRSEDFYTRTAGVRWILAWESMEQRDQRWAGLFASKEWETVAQESRDENGEPLFHLGAEVTFLKAWPESPMQ